MAWTKEKIRCLDELSKPGALTARQIADRLSERFDETISRNSVLSKMRGLGLQNRLRGNDPEAIKRRRKASEPENKAKAAKKPVQKSPVIVSVKPAANNNEAPVPRPAMRAPYAARDAVEALEPGDCRWPIGDPRRSDFHFCCRQRVPGLPYCESHQLKARRRLFGVESDEPGVDIARH